MDRKPFFTVGTLAEHRYGHDPTNYTTEQAAIDVARVLQVTVGLPFQPVVWQRYYDTYASLWRWHMCGHFDHQHTWVPRG